MKEKQELSVKSDEDFLTFLDPYKNNSILRGLFQFAISVLSISHPISAFTVTGIETALFTWRENQKNKWKSLAEELNNWEQLCSELLENADFLHCFNRIIEAIETTQSHEKIRYFARLLKASTEPAIIASIDEYEEFLSILKELSSRELHVLTILDKYESQFPIIEGESPIARSDKFWKQFTTELNQELHIPIEEVRFILSRLTRTGCYQMFIKNRSGAVNSTGDCGRLTPVYYHLKKIINS